MRKQILSSVVLGVVAVLTLTSCAKKVSEADAEAQANKYSQSTVDGKYSGATVKTVTNTTKATGTFETLGYATGKKEDSESGSATVVTADEIKAAYTAYGDNITFYLKGSALSYKIASTTSETTLVTTKVAMVTSGDASYDSDGLPASSNMTVKMTIGTSSELDQNITVSYTYTKK
jgi:hypothetical protein